MTNETTNQNNTEEPVVDELSNEELDQVHGGKAALLGQGAGGLNFKVEIDGVRADRLKLKSSPSNIRVPKGK